MRTIKRDIVGAYIFSADNKILLGHNKKGGAYPGMLVIPAGGIEDGETELGALKREILEETGIDISQATITPVGETLTGESEKVLQDTGERVFVKMNFSNFVVRLPEAAQTVNLRFEDDYAYAGWYAPGDLRNAPIGPNTKLVLRKINFLR